MGVLFLWYSNGKGGYMDEANKKLKEDIAIAQQIRKNAEEWRKTKSVSLASETMDLLIKIVPEKEKE